MYGAKQGQSEHERHAQSSTDAAAGVTHAVLPLAPAGDASGALRTPMVALTPRSCAALASTLVRCPRSRTSERASSLAPFSLPFLAAALISTISFFSSLSMDSSSRSKSGAPRSAPPSKGGASGGMQHDGYTQ